jgi:hypothetical protein
MTTTEAEKPTNNGKSNGVAEGFAEGIAGSVEGLTAFARDQAQGTFDQGTKMGMVLRDQSILSIKAVEDIGLSLLATLSEITAPFTPKWPSMVPVGNLDLLVKAGFDISLQVLKTERKLAESAVAMVVVAR